MVDQSQNDGIGVSVLLNSPAHAGGMTSGHPAELVGAAYCWLRRCVCNGTSRDVVRHQPLILIRLYLVS